MSGDTGSSGIYVMEGPARGQPIPVDSDFVTAFVGPAPRGPVDHAVPVASLDEFLKVFGVPDFHCRMEFAIRQFFTNGGRQAVVVRVSGTDSRNRIHLPAPHLRRGFRASRRTGRRRCACHTGLCRCAQLAVADGVVRNAVYRWEHLDSLKDFSRSTAHLQAKSVFVR